MADKEVRIKIKIGSEYKEVSLANDEVKKISTSLNTAETSVDKFYKKASNTAGVVVGFVAIKESIDLVTSAAGRYIDKADEMTSINSKLKLSAKNTNDLATSQQRLFEIANNARMEFGSTVDLYSRLERNTRELNISQERLFGTTDTINKAMIVSGGSADSLNAAVVQLSQGIAAGALRGEELNSVMEQTPRLSQAIADGMGIGTGQLREYAEAGKITSEVIIKALEDQAFVIEQEFKKIDVTFASSRTVWNNASTFIIGEIDKTTRASAKFANLIIGASSSLVKNKDDIVDFAVATGKIAGEIAQVTLAAGGAYVAFKTWNSATKTYNALTATGIIRTNAYGQVIASTTLKTRIATTATKAFSTVLKATPFGLVTTAVYLLTDAFLDNASKSEMLEEAYAGVSSNLKDLTKNQLEYRKSLIETELIQARLDLANAKADVANNSLFESKKEQLEDKAYLDEVRKKFNNITKASRDLKAALVDLKIKETITKDTTIAFGEFKKLTAEGKASASEVARFKENLTKQEKENQKKIKESLKEEEKLRRSIIVTSLSQWQDYYKKIGDYETAWQFERVELAKKYTNLTKEQFENIEAIAKQEFFFDLRIKPIFDEFDTLAKNINSLDDLENLALETEWNLLLSDASEKEINKLYEDIDAKQKSLIEGLSFKPVLDQLEELKNEWNLALETYPDQVAAVNQHYLKKEEDLLDKKIENNDQFLDDMEKILVDKLAGALTSWVSGGEVDGKALLSGLGSTATNWGIGQIIGGFTGSGDSGSAGTAPAGQQPQGSSGADTASMAGGALSAIGTMASIPVLGWIGAIVGLVASFFGGKEKVDETEQIHNTGQAMAQQLIEELGYDSSPLDDFNEAIKEATKVLDAFSNSGSSFSEQISLLTQTEDYQGKKAADLMAAYQEKVNLAYANAFTETGAMYASMAGKLKIEADKAAEIADEANSDLKTAIVDAASEGLDYSLYSIQELDSLISGIDYTAYRDTLKEISDISLVVKDTKIMTDQQQEALISLYSGENFIKARDAKDIKDAIEAQIQSIKDLEDSAVEFIDTTFATFMDNIKDLGTVIFDLADETKSTIESIKFSGYSEKDQLVEFNKLRTEISSYFDGTANFSEDELSSKYSSLLSFGTNVASSSESLRGDILNYLDGNLGKFNDQENILRVNIVDGLSQIEGFSQEQSLSLKDAIADGRLSLSELLEIKDLSTAQIQSIINMVDNTEAIAKDDTLNYVLLSNMEGFNALADAAKEASKTEIISGLDNLELYSQNQLVALREALADTVITNNELNNIAGLTEQQKDNIITVANNSEYFSTESTLGLMTTLLQYQLEELKKTNALETTGLSSSSFEYGDYIGKQEQIDISNIFGRAYDENIAETIKRLQGLNLSANPEEELKSLLGYTGYGDTSYQKDLGSTLLKLDPYLSSVNIPDVISSIDTEMNAYNEKQAFLSTLESARTNYELQKSQSDAQLAKFAPFNSKQEDFENNSKAVLSPFGMYFLSSYYSAYEKEFEEAYSSYATYKSLLNQKQILGYENGTSNMKDDQLALFNNQEIVIPTSFSEGIRNGDISMSNNQELLDEHRKTRDAILLAVEELKDINSSTGEMNSRQQITIKKVS